MITMEPFILVQGSLRSRMPPARTQDPEGGPLQNVILIGITASRSVLTKEPAID